MYSVQQQKVADWFLAKGPPGYNGLANAQIWHKASPATHLRAFAQLSGATSSLMHAKSTNEVSMPHALKVA